MLIKLNRGWLWTLSAGLSVAFAVGCGSGSEQTGDTKKAQPQIATGAPAAPESAEDPFSTGDSNPATGKILRTAAIGNPKAGGVLAIEDKDKEDDAELNAALKGPPPEGTAEWHIYEATGLCVQRAATPEEELEGAGTEKLRAVRKERNEKIINHAQKAIALIHDKPEKAPLFQTAVRHLLDARMQLAQAGEKEHIEGLFEDSAALAQRDPQSQAAAEAARSLVELAYFHARNAQKDDTRWLQEFAFQATHFATQFPKEEPRSVGLLFTAAQSCELFGLTKEAMTGYAVIVEKFPNNAYVPRTLGILRRLRLPGKSLELSGPTLDGKQFNIASLRGKPVLVVFWSTEAEPCIEKMPVIIATAKKFTPDRLSVVGVNLDSSSTPVTQFLVSHKIGWPQIFYPTAEKREWKHPVVNQYSIMQIPSLWLIDAAGRVVTTSVDSDDLEAELEKLNGTTGGKPATARETNASEDSAPQLDAEKLSDDAEETPAEKPALRATKKARTTSSKTGTNQ